MPKARLIEELNLHTRPKKSLGSGNQTLGHGKKFEGAIYGDNFQITRIINYRNSFLPEVYGRIIEKSNGTEIAIELKPVKLVMAFMSFWLGGVTLAFIAILAGVIIGESPITACVIPLIMLLGGFGMLQFGFSTESEKSKKELTEILQAKLKSDV